MVSDDFPHAVHEKHDGKDAQHHAEHAEDDHHVLVVLAVAVLVGLRCEHLYRKEERKIQSLRVIESQLLV